MPQERKPIFDRRVLLIPSAAPKAAARIKKESKAEKQRIKELGKLHGYESRQVASCLICKSVSSLALLAKHFRVKHKLKPASGFAKAGRLRYALNSRESNLLFAESAKRREQNTRRAQATKNSRFTGKACCPRCKRELQVEYLLTRHLCVPDKAQFFLDSMYLPFTVLPTDRAKYRAQFRAHLESNGHSKYSLQRDEFERLDFVFQTLKPNKWAFGVNGLLGYAVFSFQQHPRVLLESIRTAHAAYVLNGDWEAMIHRSRSAIRSEYRGFHRRVVHTGSWKKKLREYVNSGWPSTRH